MIKCFLKILFLCFCGLNVSLVYGQTKDITYFNYLYQDTDTSQIGFTSAIEITNKYYVLGRWVEYSDLILKNVLYIINSDGEIENNIIIEEESGGKNLTFNVAGTLLQKTKDNELLVLSNYSILDQNSAGYSIVKMDTLGNEIWRQDYFEADQSQEMAAIIVDSLTNDFVVCGTKLLSGTNQYNLIAIKYDEYGNQVWERIIENTDGVLLSGSYVWWDEGYVFSGYNYENDSLDYDTKVVKLDKDGNVEWIENYGTTGIDSAGPIATSLPDDDEQIFYLFSSDFEYDNNIFSNILNFRKLSSIGEEITQIDYPEFYPSFSWRTDPVRLDNKFYFSNTGIEGANENRQPRISIINTSGFVIKHNLLIYDQEANYVYIQDIRPAEGGLIMAGFKWTYPGPAWLIKTDSLLNTCWPPNCDSTVTVQLPVDVGLDELVTIPSIPSLHIHPNPVQDHFYFSHPQAPMQPGRIIIYDAAGKEVLRESVHSHRDRVAVSELAAGTYQVLLQVVTGQRYWGKVVVVE